MSGASPSITVKCPRCKKVVPADNVQAGMRLCCPSCSMDFLVTGNSLGRDLDEEEEYGLKTPLPAPPAAENRKPADVPDVYPLHTLSTPAEIDLLTPRSEAEEVALYQQVMRDEELDKKASRQHVSKKDEEELEPTVWHPKKLPPEGLYRTGLFRFLLHVEVLIRLACLAVLIFLAMFVTARAKGQIDTPNFGMASFGAWFGGMMFLAIGILLGIGCLIYASALSISILLDTSNGLKRVESWPRGFIFEWMHETGYLLGAIFWSELPAVPLAWVLQGSNIPPAMIHAATAAIFFPLALLAALDANTFFFPGSPDVVTSPFRSRRAWLDFYLITVPLLTLVAGMAVFAIQKNLAWLIFVSSVFAAVGWLLYFRLLGRLAWYASAKAESSE